MSNDVVVFPDTQRILTDLIQGAMHLDDSGELRPVEVQWHLQVEGGGLAGPFPLLHILPPRGTIGFLDRVDRVTLELYTEGGRASTTLESICATITGTDIESASGYLDSVTVVTAPEDVPYQSDALSLARATLDVISRPV